VKKMRIQKLKTKTKQKLEDIIRGVKENIGKTILAASLATAIGTTIAKNNVHFAAGSLYLHNPKGTHYVWGLYPTVRVDGDGEDANIVSLGLLGSHVNVSDSSKVNNIYSLGTGLNTIISVGKGATVKGNITSCGIDLFLIGNGIREGSTVKGNITSCGIDLFTLNIVGEGSTVEGDISIYGLSGFLMQNSIGCSSDSGKVSNGVTQVKGDVRSIGLGLLNYNVIKGRSIIEGNSHAGYGLIMSSSNSGEGKIEGNETAYGTIAETSTGTSLISRSECKK